VAGRPEGARPGRFPSMIPQPQQRSVSRMGLGSTYLTRMGSSKQIPSDSTMGTYQYTDDAAGWEELSAQARLRDYSLPDGVTTPEHALDHLGASALPHPSRGLANHSTSSNFRTHLQGVESVLRRWQLADGVQAFPDSVCLGGLFHSIYGTQGFQAFRFPPESRAQITALVGERGERAAFYTCVMERSSWNDLLAASAGCVRGQAPTGAIRPRHKGSIADVGYLRADEEWELTAEEFTDLCAVSLAHRLEHNECNRSYDPSEELFAIMVS
jgi:hypothetical protein